ncbi:MAG TPA: aminotransferase class V-fold PLP-dependent enzyme [Aliidongia sp.]|nr:aminotransferase class V-fold PLP-dependent enzyme [Aliidongia sp.]
MPTSLPLDVDPDTFRTMVGETGDFLAAFLRRVPDMPAWKQEGGTDILADPALRKAPSEDGRPLAELLRALERGLDLGSNTASGRFFTAIPNGGLPTVAIAELISNTVNKFSGKMAGGPSLVAIENDIIAWLIQAMGMPSDSNGILTSGGSMATLSALACARDAAAPGDLRQGVIYTTDQAHFAIAKAARLVGFPREAVRTVATDAAGRMDPARLIDTIRADRGNGLKPFCLVASAGTTNTGVVDPLPALAEIAERERLWLHIDAAYGGFFRLTARGSDKLQGIERGDSLVLDPHKGLFLPFGTGCLLMRDAAALHRTHAADEAAFFRDMKKGEADFADLSPELTRPARGLRLWLPLHLHGVGAFRRELDEKLDLARTAWKRLSDIPGISVQAPPALSIVTFRASGWPGSDDDRATETLVREVCADGRLRFSTTLVDGKVAGRLAILSHRTSAAEVDELLHRIREVAASHLS